MCQWAHGCYLCGNLSPKAYDYISPLRDLRLRLAMQILPDFVIGLAELKSVLTAQVNTVKDMKAKVMGVAVTAGITFGQLLVKEIIPYVRSERD